MQDLSDAIDTSSGPVRGRIEKNIIKFLGIPYAEPPINELRWKPPVPKNFSQKILNCVGYAYSSPQLTNNVGPLEKYEKLCTETNENCLFLNIFTPITINKNLPIMVWVHGGGNIIGSSANYLFDGSRLASNEIIVVTINYRLGALGFLAYKNLPKKEGENNFSGNYGLLDQIEALKWIKKNIANFNGNPNNITVFGQSAGSINISVLLSSNLANGLISKAILQSGTEETMQILMPDSYGDIRKVSKNAKALIKNLKLHNNIYSQLMNMPVDKLVNATGHFDHIFHTFPEFQPIEDNYILPHGGLSAAFNNKSFQQIPILIGFTQDEGNIFKKEISISLFKKWINTCFNEQTAKFLFKYIDLKTEFDTSIGIAKIFKLLGFVLPSKRLADYMCRFSNVYMYSFNRISSCDLCKNHGAVHSSELPYVFGNLNIVGIDEEIDHNISNTVIQYWTNFAKNGNPNSSNIQIWPKYTHDTPTILNISETISIDEIPEKEMCNIFNRLIFS